MEALARIDTVLGMRGLSQNVKVDLRRARNSLRHNLKADDLTGALRDRAGVPVPKATGGVFRHADEVGQGLESLHNAKVALVGALPDGVQRGWNADAQRLQEAVTAIDQLQRSIVTVVGVRVPR